MWVSLAGGSLAAASEMAVLNGANRVLVETEAGWELVQFRDAELVDVETWKLSMLLRGQQGSEDAMSAGAPVGERILFLVGAEQRLSVADWERGLELEWRAGEWAGAYAHEAVGARPWSPAHLSLGWLDGDIALAWVRRARKDGDGWGAGNPPVEGSETYRVRVRAENQTARGRSRLPARSIRLRNRLWISRRADWRGLRSRSWARMANQAAGQAWMWRFP